MFLAETNKKHRLLHLIFIGHVTARELQQGQDEMTGLMAELQPGFRLLTDLTHLSSMEIECEVEIARTMETCGKMGISAVVRVIPEPHKDIGFNILSALHYKRDVQVATCKSLEEAMKFLQPI